jgi:hypothetical protein
MSMGSKGPCVLVALCLGAASVGCGSGGPSDVRLRECAALDELSKQLHAQVDAQASVKRLESAKDVDDYVTYHRKRAQATREVSQGKDSFTEAKVRGYAERLRKAYADEADANQQIAAAYEAQDREAVAKAGSKDLEASRAQVALIAEWTDQCRKP